MQIDDTEVTVLPPPAAQAQQSTRFMSRMFRKYYMPALLSVPGVLVVLTVTLGMIATGTWAVLQVGNTTTATTTAIDSTITENYYHYDQYQCLLLS
jgi:hypothetical protein